MKNVISSRYPNLYLTTFTQHNHLIKLIIISFPQGNVYLVDTPGIGTNSHLNEVLFDFLPNAGSFIFVIDATAADNPSRNNVGSIEI